MARNWTPEERKKQSDKVKDWKPWQDSTGPKTPEGKETSKHNATKHGLFTEEGVAFRRTIKGLGEILDGL